MVLSAFLKRFNHKVHEGYAEFTKRIFLSISVKNLVFSVVKNTAPSRKDRSRDQNKLE